MNIFKKKTFLIALLGGAIFFLTKSFPVSALQSINCTFNMEGFDRDASTTKWALIKDHNSLLECHWGFAINRNQYEVLVDWGQGWRLAPYLDEYYAAIYNTFTSTGNYRISCYLRPKAGFSGESYLCTNGEAWVYEYEAFSASWLNTVQKIFYNGSNPGFSREITSPSGRNIAGLGFNLSAFNRGGQCCLDAAYCSGGVCSNPGAGMSGCVCYSCGGSPWEYLPEGCRAWGSTTCGYVSFLPGRNLSCKASGIVPYVFSGGGEQPRVSYQIFADSRSGCLGNCWVEARLDEVKLLTRSSVSSINPPPVPPGRCSSVYGYVKTPGGTPIAGAQVTAHRIDNSVGVCQGGHAGCTTDTTDSVGRWDVVCTPNMPCLGVYETVNAPGCVDSGQMPSGPVGSTAWDANTIVWNSPTADICGPFTFYDECVGLPTQPPSPTPTLTPCAICAKNDDNDMISHGLDGDYDYDENGTDDYVTFTPSSSGYIDRVEVKVSNVGAAPRSVICRITNDTGTQTSNEYSSSMFTSADGAQWRIIDYPTGFQFQVSSGANYRLYCRSSDANITWNSLSWRVNIFNNRENYRIHCCPILVATATPTPQPTNKTYKIYLCRTGLSWFQVFGGGVKANGTLGVSLPSGEELLVEDASGSVGALALGTASLPSLGEGTVGGDDWFVANYHYNGNAYDLSFFTPRLASASEEVELIEVDDSKTLLSEVTELNCAATESTCAVSGGRKVIVFRPETTQFSINRKVTVEPGSFFALLNIGRIVVYGFVSEIQGVYLTEGNFIVNNPDSNPAQLNIYGIVVADAGLGRTNGVVIERNLETDNKTTPAVVFHYRPDLLFNMPKELWKSEFEMEELLP